MDTDQEIFEIHEREQEEAAAAEDLADDIAYANTPVKPDTRTLEECVADEYEEGIW